MYRQGAIYDEIAKVVIQIYLDYNLTTFPIDEQEVCRKLGVSLVRYSSMPKDAFPLLIKKSEYGFFVPETKDNPPTIYYNDMQGSKGSIRFTIFHELKHYVFEDYDDADDDLADYFARYFMCPIPYLLLLGINSPSEVMSRFGTTYTAATNVCSNLIKRKAHYGLKIFDYETELMIHLDAILYAIYAE